MSNIECVRALLENNSDMNLTDCDLRTPLHAAVRRTPNALEIIKLMIDYKADINAKDKYGYLCEKYIFEIKVSI